jgi:DNA-binding NtrC family response regulator
VTTPRLLLIEDDPVIRFAVRDFMEANGYAVSEAASAAEGERIFERERPTVVVTDYKLPDATALDLLPRLRATSATTPIIVLTGHGSVELAVQAMREGADDFLTKPVSLPTLLVVIERAMERQRERQQRLARQVRRERSPIDPFIGTSAAIQRLRDQAMRVAETDRPVLLFGETGSGKGVLTRWMHEHGPRRDEPIVDLNCASLPRELLESELFGYERGAFTGAVNTKLGLVELANRGTLFLDEIGDMELSLQPKLLKVVEDQVFRRVGAVKDRQVNVRLVAATHQDLPALVDDGRFRGDLYFRISTLPLQVPPLRERVEDIPLLARRLLDRLTQEIGGSSIQLTTDARRALEAHPWPGNIREMRNVLERAVLLGSRTDVRAADLSFDSRGRPMGAPAGESDTLTLEEVQRRHIIRALELANGRVDQAAARLGVPRSTLYQRLKAMQIVAGRPSSALPSQEPE